MTRFVRHFPMAIAALAFVVGAQPSLADAGIRDEAGLFSPEAVRKAEAVVRKMASEHKKELYIETLATLPSVEKGGPDLKNDAATRKWLNEYAIGRAKSHSVDGVYFLLVKEPRKFQFEVGSKTQEKAFTQTNRVEAEKLIVPYLKDRKMDEALSALVNFVSSKVTEHDRGGNHARVNHQGGAGGENSIMGYVCLGGLVIGGIFLMMGLFRAFTGMGGGGGGGMGGPGMGGGGGGFMSNFLGGMFGAAAGMWMYDSFFGHGGSRAWGSGSDGTTSGSDFGGDRDTDYSGGGGDYGGDSSSSGGDWGGGGGGDWGGGGGGDFGGGGGGGDY